MQGSICDLCQLGPGRAVKFGRTTEQELSEFKANAYAYVVISAAYNKNQEHLSMKLFRESLGEVVTDGEKHAGEKK